MSKRKPGTRTAKGRLTAPLYIIGPRTVEWSYDMVNFHSADAESFGEYASRCFAAGKPKRGG